MLLKQSGEHSSPDFINLKFELGAALKAVPIVKPGLLHIIYPIRLQPFDNIVVAGKQDNLPITFSPCLCESGRSDLGDLSVDYRSELVDDCPFGPFTYQAGQASAELLTVTQDGKWPTADNAPVTALKSPSGAMQSTIGFVASHPAYKS